jgi:hypothetical protein
VVRKHRSQVERNLGSDLIGAVTSSVHEQIAQDGSARTPAGSADERKMRLTEHFKDAHIVAHLVDDGRASIHKRGVTHEVGDGSDTWIESVDFSKGKGRIAEVSSSHCRTKSWA